MSVAQKQIIGVGIAALLGVIIFWIFFVYPQSKSLGSLKKELKDTESQIAQILSLASGKELGEAVREFRLALHEASQKLPLEDEVAIADISEAAAKLKINLKSITPQATALIKDKVTGYEIEELPISLDLSCTFRTLGDYLAYLKDGLPILVRLRHLEVKSSSAGNPNLEVALQISAYLAREKK